MDSLSIERKRETFVCDSSRVITRFYAPLDEARTEKIVERVLSLSEEECRMALQMILKDFSTRHHNFEAILLSNYKRVKKHLTDPEKQSKERKLLIGAYFTHEYSVESAALFNPSIVAHPDQTNLPSGSMRFIISFRGIGEGHLSSIVFRTGVLDQKNNMTMDAVSPYVEQPAIEFNPSYNKNTFLLKLNELGADTEISARILDPLPDEFLFKQLKDSIRQVRSTIPRTVVFQETNRVIDWLVRSNYEVVFRGDQPLSERVIFPVSEDERNGIEDARFVRFSDTGIEGRYYATYTAYNGHSIMPMLIETQDFLRFRMRTLNGEAARNKGMALFPRRVNGLYTMISRQDGENLYIVQSDNIHVWNEVKELQRPKYSWEFIQIGNCGSPIETKKGWLLLTHGVGPLRKYCIGAELLDLKNPSKIIGRLEEPLIMPNEYEREGYVPNVAYTCGAIVHNDVLVIPYGVSDTSSCVATIKLGMLLDRLTQ
jgi:predicted GH43/DUF377 family glycosyl hydrolase